MGKKINCILLILSIISYFNVAASLTVMAFDGVPTPGISSLGLICGICFWVFLIAGTTLQVVLSNRIRKRKIEQHRMRRNMKNQPKLGLISFFRNPLGAASDILFLLAVVSFGIACYQTQGSGIVCYISLSLMFFSFCAHCIFNGKNYFYITNYAFAKSTLTETEEN